jgi:hypothetical protein
MRERDGTKGIVVYTTDAAEKLGALKIVPIERLVS